MKSGSLLRCWVGCALAVVVTASGGQTAQAPQQEAPKPAPAQVVPRPGALPEVFAADLREQVDHIPVTVKNLAGREETRTIPLTIFRPPGEGRFPLVVLSHGRAVGERRAQQGRQRFEVQARYLVSKGFVVIVPTRVGYGDTFGEFDPENTGGCGVMRIEPAALAASDQVLAAVQYARSLPYVDAARWVAMGQSVGGLATVAVAWRHPPGLVAAINFSGGAGGDPERRPGNPCTPSQIEKLWGTKAAEATVPMLWLYWENDLFWGAELPRRWAHAWADGGGRVEFHMLPPVGTDGHAGFGRDMDRWVPLVEAYLAQRGFSGFTQPGLIPRPPPSAFAAIDDAARVPVAPAARDQVYSRFLAAKAPRAFAVGPNGASGWATGDWAMGRALGFCQARRGGVCKLYAVDDDVVWTP